ncbi:MAG: threonine-phosphate decarboxylase CobD [Bacillota bacterium]
MKQIHGGNIEEVKKLYNLKDEEIVDFSSNINFSGPPPGLYELIVKKINKMTRYPEPYAESLESDLADFLEINQENLVTGNGGVEIIYELFKNLDEVKTVLLPVPTFFEYEQAAKSFDKKIKYFTLNKANYYKLNIDNLYSYLDKVDLIFICNPNNPTGNLLKKNKLLNLIRICQQKNIFLVVDEAFIDFQDEVERYSVIDQVTRYQNIFVLRSMTKFYAIPGLRLGYGVGNNKLINKIRRSKIPWSVNIFAQMAGKMVLTQKKFRKKSVRENKKERNFLYSSLKEIDGFVPLLPAANYIGIDISEYKYNAPALTDILAQKGILIRDCSSYKGLGNNFIRIAVKNRKKNMILLDHLTGLE